MKLKIRVYDIDGNDMSAGIDLDAFMKKDEDLEFPETGESLPFNDFLYWRNEYSDFMVFTGRLDRNGKEIYEEDIVVCHPEKKYGRRVVVRDFYEGFNNGDGGDFEIIGNTYQNKNLLISSK